MDRVTRRSAVVSLALHGVLVAVSLFALGPPPPPPAPPARAPAGAPPAAGAQAPLTIAAEDAVLSPARPGPLPRLTAVSAVPPPLPVIRATATDRQGDARRRGSSGTDPASVDLPKDRSIESPTVEGLRGLYSNPAMSHEADMLATAQGHLEYRIGHAYLSRWRAYASQVSNRRLVVWLVVDGKGRVQRGGLYQCSSGSPDLDRALEALLLEKDLGLPPIAPGVVTWFQVTLP